MTVHDVTPWITQPQDASAITQSSKAWAAILVARQRLRLPPLTIEPVLQRAAERSAAAMAEAVRRNPHKPQLTGSDESDELRKQLPALAKLSSQVMAAADLNQILEQVSQWSGAAEPAWTHAGVVVVESRLVSGQIFFAAAIFASEILPHISPELVNQGRREFHVPCHLCGGSHLVRLRDPTSKHAGSLNGVCPHCGRLIDVFGIDSAQRYHRPTWFLRGFCPARIANPLEAWWFVLAQVQYVSDMHQYGRAEVWQLAEETYQLRRGDCEDTSILLADWLAASGYPARVVLGEQQGEGHAWVVLDGGGRHYILESTGGTARYQTMPPLSDAARDYVPRVQFDHTGVWFRTSDGWTADYSSHHQWKPGPSPPEVGPRS